jgi:hypothetical protein
MSTDFKPFLRVTMYSHPAQPEGAGPISFMQEFDSREEMMEAAPAPTHRKLQMIDHVLYYERIIPDA